MRGPTPPALLKVKGGAKWLAVFIWKAPGGASCELPPVSWTTKLKSKKQEAFHVRASGIET